MFKVQGAHFFNVQIHRKVVKICNFKPGLFKPGSPNYLHGLFSCPYISESYPIVKEVYCLIGLLSNILVSNFCIGYPEQYFSDIMARRGQGLVLLPEHHIRL